ncbi:hypothetical protein NC653_032621 [Populus alba x Populus x berolinensis]|uniref:Uncharacterized protein n=1 Tax=Populus alba x Populus x berolinensis TaxID=444605 RepID=A0AAD6Q006_9ROSI|nr:hypothetical protein NC653_032621 [Populus alba x Populus x berolinensis]
MAQCIEVTGKYQSFDCVEVSGSNGVLLYIEAWWVDVGDPSAKNYQLARYCIMFPLSRMISILQNLEKEGGIGCWVHVTIDCKEQQQVFADEEAFGNIPKKISIMASKHPCGLVLAGVAFSRSVDGSIRSRKATSRLIIVKVNGQTRTFSSRHLRVIPYARNIFNPIMAEGYVMRVNPGIGQLSIPMKFLPKIKQVADARATNVKATWPSS